ncbi:MAG: hypothetical protein AB9873_06750 [Syntrophobacteraceae bacterium]
MTVIDHLIEKTCMNMIQTMLFCLENATKGTIYRIGPPPTLQATRITSGARSPGTDDIKWGLPTSSDYNGPGKSWEQYKDRPDHVLEAMGWCVEKQASWTADNPFEDVRSVAKQLRGEIEDCHHMEPVLVRKGDIYGDNTDAIEYPLDWRGNPIWQESDYVVAAVIKIHFVPGTLQREDRSTRIIRELSRSLGTELLTLHVRESLYRAQKDFARQRLHSCEILAHELRNTLMRFGFIFSAVNAQVGVIREEWEEQLMSSFPELLWKQPVLEKLNEILKASEAGLASIPESANTLKALVSDQDEIATYSLLPNQADQWLRNKIRPKWDRLLNASAELGARRQEIEAHLDALAKALQLGTDKELAAGLTHLAPELREKWPEIAYMHFTPDKTEMVGDIIKFLTHPALPLPHKQQFAKVFRSFKALVEILPEVEERANKIILSLRYGGPSDAQTAQLLERLGGATSGQPDPGASSQVQTLAD